MVSSLEAAAEADAITIVGAGPAGLACAIALARGGRHVIVRKWRSTVGHRFHGDFQGLENWSDERDVLSELCDNGIEPNFVYESVCRGTAFDSKGRRYEFRSARPLYYLVRRGNLDGALDRVLLEQAIAAGAEIRFDDHVKEIDGPAILAGGPRVADAIAVGHVFETDIADGDWLALDNRLAPLGYAYLLVHSGRGTVATCMFTDFKNQDLYLQQTVVFFQKTVHMAMRNARRFGGYANFRLPGKASQGNHPVIGEHAGFQDALAGFGMRYALRSGFLAAQSVIEGGDYTVRWQRQLLPLLRVGIVNRFLFNIVGDTGWQFALRKISRGDAGTVLGKFYWPSFWNKFLFPVAALYFRSPMRVRSCDHSDCHCVWCECGEPSFTG
ncbi:MAG: NAD(P)/FAD-dependent oxidoreductase [Alphaproteobacteria bacterium]|nr:NAD(P)/FAD-dependent oxidoreductase [Alphaproteobacteria bacterium]